jgi:hypothetical protein
MEQKLDELLKQIHRYLFADSEQIIVELKQYLLDRNLKEAELGKPHICIQLIFSFHLR